MHGMIAPEGCEVMGEPCKAAELDKVCPVQGKVGVAC